MLNKKGLLKHLKYTTPFGTKEFAISKNGRTYILDFIGYGSWVSYSCSCLKECFSIIRSYIHGSIKH